MSEENGWAEYKRTVLQQLEFHQNELKEIKDIVTRIDKETCVEIKLLKQKVALWGAISGFVVSVVVSIVGRFFLR
jgi:hypothetical protein